MHGTVVNLTVKNNIVSGFANDAVQVVETADDTLNITSFFAMNNCFYDNGTDAVDVDVDVALDIDSDILTGNITDNPLFKSNETWRLRPASPAIDAGISVGLTHDYWGHRITGTPDIGACEFGNYVLFYGGKQLY